MVDLQVRVFQDNGRPIFSREVRNADEGRQVIDIFAFQHEGEYIERPSGDRRYASFMTPKGKMRAGIYLIQ